VQAGKTILMQKMQVHAVGKLTMIMSATQKLMVWDAVIAGLLGPGRVSYGTGGN
jgi:hypothetical protein